MVIWELTLDEDVTQYYFPDRSELEQFLFLRDNYIDEALSIKEKWAPLMLLKKEQKKKSDFGEIEDLGCFIISEKVVNSLLPILNESIELLPFKTDEGYCYLLHVAGFLENALDEELTEITRVTGGIINNIENIHFRKNIILEKSIFKISELPYVMYITDKFWDSYKESNLIGLSFSDDELIWIDD